jgi:hypothetical protein
MRATWTESALNRRDRCSPQVVKVALTRLAFAQIGGSAMTGWESDEQSSTIGNAQEEPSPQAMRRMQP